MKWNKLLFKTLSTWRKAIGKKLLISVVGSVLFILGLSTGYGQERPFWEFGVGVGAVSFADYLGSDRHRNWLLPVPYVVYRSERINVDRERASGRLFRIDRLRLDLSLSGSVPVDSDDNPQREDMPDLDPVLQFGPALEFDLYRTLPEGDRLFITLPLRSAFTVGFDEVRHIGWVSNPNLRYEKKRQTERGSWTTTTSFGPLFGDRRYHRYYYAVEPRFATPDRPDFFTSGGFGGWRFSAGFSQRSGDFWYGAFIRYYNLTGAKFANSPLVETDHSLVAGFGVAWIFARSDSAR
jgi:outer membrane scaffolding protein for murein synthesis (MipA/OmpV family)